MKKSIYLTGFMGCGKTSIGRILAQILGWKFIDTDQKIVQHVGLSIPKIFKEKGESFFRQTETQVLYSLGQETNAVVSCGGGIITQDINRFFLKQQPNWIFLDTSWPKIWKRIAHSSRPLVKAKTEAEIRDLYNQRFPYYKLAPHRFFTENLSPRAAAERIIKIL